MYEIDKSNIQLENYLFSIGQTHRQFLLKDDHSGLKNPSDTRKGIMENLGKSMRYIHEVMKVTKHLKENEIDDVFNAPNLEEFFQNLLKDTKYNSKSKSEGIPKKYNTRTSEMARVMVLTGIEYLLQSEKFKDNKRTRKDSDNLINDFKLLSKSLFVKDCNNQKDVTEDKVMKSELWNELSQKINKLEDESPIPIEYDIVDMNKIVKGHRTEIIQELFAIQNRIDYQKKDSEKNKLIKIQDQLRRELEEDDKTLEAIELKAHHEYAKISLFLSSKTNLENFLSKLYPIEESKMIKIGRELVKNMKR